MTSHFIKVKSMQQGNLPMFSKCFILENETEQNKTNHNQPLKHLRTMNWCIQLLCLSVLNTGTIQIFIH